MWCIYYLNTFIDAWLVFSTSSIPVQLVGTFIALCHIRRYRLAANKRSLFNIWTDSNGPVPKCTAKRCPKGFVGDKRLSRKRWRTPVTSLLVEVVGSTFGGQRPLFSRGGRYIDEKLSKADILVFLKLSAIYRYRKMEILKLSKNYRYRKMHQILADN